MTPEELPPEARHAFENYPQIEPSAAFNRAVLDSLAAAQTRRRPTFIGRIEEMLGLSLWQFAASGMLGAFLPALVVGALLLSNRGAAPLPPAPVDPLVARNIGPLYARELWRDELGDEPIAASPRAEKGDELSCIESKFPLV